MSDFTPQIFNSLAELTLFSLMLSLGLTVSFRQIISLWQKPGLLNRAIVGMNVISPILAIAIGFAMRLPAEVKMGLALISLSPGTSLPLHYLVKTGKRHLYTGALQTTTAFLAIITVPLTIAILNEFLPEAVQIAPFAVVQQMFVFQLLPLMAGLMLGILGIVCYPNYSPLLEQSAEFLAKAATLLLYGLLVWALGQQVNTLLELGIPSIAAIGLLALVSLWLGHWIGGKEVATRALLALTLSTHNVALALVIAITSLPSIVICPVIAVYVVISVGLAISYSKWHQRRLRKLGAE
jgi:BASS family bile acid:Na+ symporter